VTSHHPRVRPRTPGVFPGVPAAPLTAALIVLILELESIALLRRVHERAEDGSRPQQPG
jgi:hypothetical protein